MPGRPEITSTDRAPVLKVLAWVMAVCMCLFVSAKVLGKRLKRSELGLDDILIISAMGLAVGQTVALTFQASVGLGRNQLTSTAHPHGNDLAILEKSIYAAEIAYVVALVAAKGASLRLIQTIAPVTTILIALKVGAASVVVLGLVGLFGTVFQCAPPFTWQVLSSHCFNRPAFFVFLNVVDILLDTFIFLLPTTIVWRLQMPVSRRLPIVIAFGMRALVLPLVILRIIYLLSTVQTTGGWRDFNLALVTTLQMHFEIVATCIPFLRPLVDQMYHGFTTSDLSRAPMTISRREDSNIKDSLPLRRLPRSLVSTIGGTNGNLRASKPHKDLNGSTTRLRPEDPTELSYAHEMAPSNGENAVTLDIEPHQRGILVHTTITTSID